MSWRLYWSAWGVSGQLRLHSETLSQKKVVFFNTKVGSVVLKWHRFISFLNRKETKHIAWIYLSSNPVDTPKIVHILLISAQDSLTPKYLGLDPGSMARFLRTHSSHWLRNSEQSFQSWLLQFTVFYEANQAHIIKSRLIWTTFPFFSSMCSFVYPFIWKLLVMDCPGVFSISDDMLTSHWYPAYRCVLAAQYPTEQPSYWWFPFSQVSARPVITVLKIEKHHSFLQNKANRSDG